MHDASVVVEASEMQQAAVQGIVIRRREGRAIVAQDAGVRAQGFERVADREPVRAAGLGMACASRWVRS